MQVESPNPIKRCDYCGLENVGEALSCRGCGSPFPLPPNPEGHDPDGFPPLLPEPPRLTARTATVVFLAYLGAQFFGALLISTFAYAAHPGVIQDKEELRQLQQKIMPPAVVVGMVASSVVLPLIARLMLPGRLRDTSPEGAAWVPGSRKQMAQAFGVGVLVGCCWIAAIMLFGVQNHQPGPLVKMALTPGLPKAVFLFVALAQAPVFEELLFRGILYGGLRYSVGVVPAVVLTTLLFCLMHLPETIHFKIGLLGIAIMGLITLWFRLRCAAIGPAIAAHLGYNTVLSLMVCLA